VFPPPMKMQLALFTASTGSVVSFKPWTENPACPELNVLIIVSQYQKGRGIT